MSIGTHGIPIDESFDNKFSYRNSLTFAFWLNIGKTILRFSFGLQRLNFFVFYFSKLYEKLSEFTELGVPPKLLFFCGTGTLSVYTPNDYIFFINFRDLHVKDGQEFYLFLPFFYIEKKIAVDQRQLAFLHLVRSCYKSLLYCQNVITPLITNSLFGNAWYESIGRVSK